MKKIARLAFAAALLAVPAASQAQVIGFEDAPAWTVLQNYNGLNFAQIVTLPGATYPGSGYANGQTGDMSTYWGGGWGSAFSSSTGSAFNFVGADFTAAWQPNENITISGYLQGVLMGQVSSAIVSSNATFVTANFSGVDEVRLDADGQQVDMDNLTLSAVVATPEPASLTLLGTGLFGIAGLARRRRRSA